MQISKSAAVALSSAAERGDLNAIGRLTNGLAKGDVIGGRHELTASGAILGGVDVVVLTHATVAVAATIADLSAHRGWLAILDGSASGTAAHTVTVTNGTLNGTNKVATLNAPGEMLLVYVGEDGNGTVILNNGGVALS